MEEKIHLGMFIAKIRELKIRIELLRVTDNSSKALERYGLGSRNQPYMMNENFVCINRGTAF